MTLQLAATAACDDLFAPACDAAHPRVLVDDAQGGIRYWPGVIDAGTAQRWFDLLRDHAQWQAMQRPMYDRLVAVPRLLAGYRVEAFPDELPLRALLDHVQALAPAPYTSVGLNLYRDGNDSVAMHGDKLHTLCDGHPVTLVSLGAPRRMLIRANAGARETVSIDLMPGSVLSMSHAAHAPTRGSEDEACSGATHERRLPRAAGWNVAVWRQAMTLAERRSELARECCCNVPTRSNPFASKLAPAGWEVHAFSHYPAPDSGRDRPRKLSGGLRKEHVMHGITRMQWMLVIGLALAGVASARAQDSGPVWDGETLPPVQYPRLPATATEAGGFVPEGWQLERSVQGDLDADGRSDLVLLLRMRDPRNVLRNEGLGEPRFDTNPRLLVVAFRSGAAYRLALQDHSLVPRQQDPVEDDYLQGDDAVAIVRGTLRVRLYSWRSAGGWGTWNNQFTFRWQQGCFRLIGFDRSHVQRNSGETVDTSVNYLTRRATVAEGNIEEDAVRTRRLRIAKAPLRCLQDLGSGMDFEPVLPAAPQDG